MTETATVRGGTRRPGSSVTSRVLAILGAFDITHPALTLTDIARRTGLPLATVHRLVGELVAGQALSRGPGGGYTIGPRVWELGLLSPLHLRLREVAAPYLHDLSSATRENGQLAVRDGDLGRAALAGAVSYLAGHEPGGRDGVGHGRHVSSFYKRVLIL
ncbi:MAG: helix-turn-helix domain-containing protein [Actinomadura sp.]